MNISKQYIDVDYYKRPPLTMNLKHIVIHSTANPKSTAQNERDNLANNFRYNSKGSKVKVSFHSAVDDNEVVECIPISEGAYHTGNYDANREGYSVEICESGDRSKTIENAVNYVAKLLVEHNLEVGCLRRHKDFTGKNCPRIFSDNEWSEFKQMVQNKMELSTEKSIEIIKDKTMLSDKTIEFLMAYRYGDDLVKKLAQAMI